MWVEVFVDDVLVDFGVFGVCKCIVVLYVVVVYVYWGSYDKVEVLIVVYWLDEMWEGCMLGVCIEWEWGYFELVLFVLE